MNYAEAFAKIADKANEQTVDQLQIQKIFEYVLEKAKEKSHEGRYYLVFTFSNKALNEAEESMLLEKFEQNGFKNYDVPRSRNNPITYAISWGDEEYEFFEQDADTAESIKY